MQSFLPIVHGKEEIVHTSFLMHFGVLSELSVYGHQYLEMESITKWISNIITLIVLSPLLMVAMVGLIIYWVCKFPFWYVERRKWYRNEK